MFSSRLPSSVRALTVVDNCITGTSAITSIYDSIVAGRAEIGLAGGVESMSNPSVLFSKPGQSHFPRRRIGKNAWTKAAKMLVRLRPSDFKPGVPGVQEPSTGLSMGEHTELTVKEWESLSQ